MFLLPTVNSLSDTFSVHVHHISYNAAAARGGDSAPSRAWSSENTVGDESTTANVWPDDGRRKLSSKLRTEHWRKHGYLHSSHYSEWVMTLVTNVLRRFLHGPREARAETHYRFKEQTLEKHSASEVKLNKTQTSTNAWKCQKCLNP